MRQRQKISTGGGHTGQAHKAPHDPVVKSTEGQIGSFFAGARAALQRAKNSGTLSAIAPIKVTFYRDQALTQEIGSAVYDPNTRGAVAGCTWDGRNSEQVSVLWNNLPVGTYSYWAKIDTLNAVPETKETDNVTTRGTVTVKSYGTFIPLTSRALP